MSLLLISGGVTFGGDDVSGELLILVAFMPPASSDPPPPPLGSVFCCWDGIGGKSFAFVVSFDDIKGEDDRELPATVLTVVNEISLRGW